MSTRSLPPGVEVVNTDAIPQDNAAHAGQQAIQLRTATGATAWGFGETPDDAVSDALAALAEDLIADCPEVHANKLSATSGYSALSLL